MTGRATGQETGPRIVLTMTVRNERELLRHNLRYHHFLGVDECIVYTDGTTDDTVATVADLPYVTVLDTVSKDAYRDRVELKDLVEHYDYIVTARQSLNIVDALERSRTAGAEWLLQLDADEIVCLNRRSSQPGELKRLLASLPPYLEVVRFQSHEICQRRMSYDHVFAEETLFATPEAKYERWLYDPLAGERFLTESTCGFLGHKLGKEAVRLSIPAVCEDMHTFQYVDGRPIPRTRRLILPYLLHYYAYSFDSFRQKFRNFVDHPDRFRRGRLASRSKRLWRDLANDSAYERQDLEDYYRDNVLLPSDAIAERRRDPAAILEITAPGEAFLTMEGSETGVESREPETGLESRGPDPEEEWRRRVRARTSVLGRLLELGRAYLPTSLKNVVRPLTKGLARPG